MEEKKIKEIRVMLQPELYDSLKIACKSNYKTISEVIRDMAVSYVRENLPSKKK